MYLDSVMYKFLFPFVFKGLHCCNLMDKGLRDIIIFVYCKYDNDRKKFKLPSKQRFWHSHNFTKLENDLNFF